MRRSSLAVLAVAFAVATSSCEWDGPPRDVRVVTSDQVGTESVAVDASGSEGGSDAGERATDDPASSPPPAGRAPGPEDHPGELGTLHMPATVAVVGDSLTVAAADEITHALSRTGVRAVIVDGRESRRMVAGSNGLPSGVAAIEGILEEHEPDLWVVALGTNDVGAAVGVDRFRADLRETLGAIPAGIPVVWVDVWIRDRIDAVVDANAVLRRELARRPAPTTVVDWFSSGSTDGVITDDGIHLTADGQVHFASEITDAVVALAVSSS